MKNLIKMSLPTLVLTLLTAGSASANLPNGSLQYSDDAHNCVLTIQPSSPQIYDISFDIFEPKMILDGGSENLFTLHQDGPDGSFLSSGQDRLVIQYKDATGTEIISAAITGSKHGVCRNLTLRSQVIK